MIGMTKLFDRWRVCQRRGQRGHAAVELALIGPWIFFLFVGVLDFGFYSYALIAVENAARVAALNAGGGPAYDQPVACRVALDELRWMPNLRTPLANCDALPLKVEIAANGYTDAQGHPATWVRVTYETLQLIPIPGLVTGKLLISRDMETRVF